MPPGRPSSYSQEIAERICLELSTNVEGLESICNRINDFPDARTVYLWRLRYEDFFQMYARARQAQVQLLADQIAQIADTTEPGEIVTIKADGEERKIADMIEHRKLKIEARKWLAMKLLPRIYGDKLDLNHGGEVAIKRVVSDL